MNRIFESIEWFNETQTAEGFLFKSFIGVLIGGGIVTLFHSFDVAIFLVAIGVIILLNLYIVTHIQRWYVSRTQERLKDFDYSEIIDETAEK